jgi:hypothetical protein
MATATLSSPPHGESRKGSLHKRSVDGARYARALIDAPTVWATLLQQVQTGELPPALLQLFLAYACGKPVDAACRCMASYVPDCNLPCSWRPLSSNMRPPRRRTVTHARCCSLTAPVHERKAQLLRTVSLSR